MKKAKQHERGCPDSACESTAKGVETVAPVEVPKSVQIASSGIDSSSKVISFTSALIADVMTERVTTKVASTVCNAMGKMLKAAELERKYSNDGTAQPFSLTDAKSDPVEEEKQALRRRLAELES